MGSRPGLNPEDLRRIEDCSRRMLEAARPVQFSRVTLAGDRESIFRQRGRVAVSRGWATLDDLPDGLERDPHDASAILVHGTWGGRQVASARILLPRENEPLPLETAHGVTLDVPLATVEVGRVITASEPGLAGIPLFTGLMGYCLWETGQAGCVRIAASANRAMLRLYRRQGWNVEVFGPGCTLWGEERFPVVFDVLASLGAVKERWPDLESGGEAASGPSGEG